ncbi:hypothetical protein CH63R_01638 [Colletotrichum higginsianum IMI 349063]|uniref:Uncharacterized protein n=1 Tax=Colletotrichum higginsianum (strain IMI 349063) TaxID=759273 RepID=A0A1B7YX77_COLHI|nr:hypothetical protein CH63R_01638 [Colletotrichum higginsianum IMI 349063]OBR16458.1 hypothetical protein CH63R_01638 [Colletotrichum higginsianum IMI 349063]
MGYIVFKSCFVFEGLRESKLKEVPTYHGEVLLNPFNAAVAGRDGENSSNEDNHNRNYHSRLQSSVDRGHMNERTPPGFLAGGVFGESARASPNQFEPENKRPSMTATHHPPCPRVRTGSAGVAGTAGDTAVPVREGDLEQSPKSTRLSNPRIGKSVDKLSSTPNTELVLQIQHLSTLGGAGAHKLLRSTYAEYIRNGQSSKRSRSSRLSLTAAYVEGSRRRSLM